MPTSVPYRFELDYTGEQSSNYVRGETHTLGEQRFRPLAPISGAYFVDKLQVWDTFNNRLLIKEIDYKCMNMSSVATSLAKNNALICTLILIINPQVSSQVHLNVQYLGGCYERGVRGIKELLNALSDDGKVVAYSDLTNKPTNFEPSPHFANVSNSIGYEYLVYELERIRQAILMGDDLGHEQLHNYIKASLDALKKTISLQNAELFQKALLASSKAVAQSTAGFTVVTQANNRINTTLDEMGALLRLSQRYVTDNIAAEKMAKEMLSNYPLSGNVVGGQTAYDNPTLAVLSPLTFAITDLSGVADEHLLYLNADGSVGEGIGGVGNAVLLIKLQLLKEPTTLRAIVRLVVTTKSNTAGEFADEVLLTLLPPDLGLNKKPLELAAFESNYFYVLNGGGLQPKIGFSNLSADATEVMPSDAVGAANVASNMASALFDFRRDFNIAGYAVAEKRSAVYLKIASDSELSMSFKLNGVAIESIKKQFRQAVMVKMKVKKTTGGVVSVVKDTASDDRVVLLSAAYPQ